MFNYFCPSMLASFLQADLRYMLHLNCKAESLYNLISLGSNWLIQ